MPRVYWSTSCIEARHWTRATIGVLLLKGHIVWDAFKETEANKNVPTGKKERIMYLKS